nr:MAG TPA: hypothetical protein [Caudoviricetes sp.]
MKNVKCNDYPLAGSICILYTKKERLSSYR